MNDRMMALAGALGISEDIAAKAVLITMIGNDHVLFQNHRGIKEYDPSVILIYGKPKNIRISGKELMIREYSDREIQIRGKIENISFEDRRIAE